MKKLGLITLLTLIGLVAALIGGAFIALQTEPVQRSLGKGLGSYLSKKGDVDVKVGRIVPTLPLQFAIQEVEVSRDGKPLLEIDQVAFSWRASGLWAGSLAFGYIEAGEIKVSTGGPPGVPKEVEWPNVPVSLSVAELSIERLEIVDTAVVSVKGEGGIESGGGDFSASVQFTPLEKKLGTYLFEIRGQAEPQDIFVHARTLPSERDNIKRFFAAAGIHVKAFNIHAFGKLDSWGAVLAGKGGPPEQQLLGDFTVVVGTDKAADTVASRLIGKKADLEGVFTIDGSQILRLKPLSADGERVQLRGEVITSLAGDIQTANLKMEIKDLSALDGVAGLTFEGAAHALLDLSGSAPNPVLTAKVDGDHVRINETPLSNLQANVTVNFGETTTGHAETSGQVESLPFSASMDLLQGEEGCWHLQNFQAEAKHATLTGELEVCEEEGLTSGSLTGRFDRLLEWAPILGLDIEGNASLNVTLDSEALLLDIVAPVLTLEEFTAEQAEIHLTLLRPFSEPSGMLNLFAQDLFYSQLEFSLFHFETKIGGEQWPFETYWTATPSSDHSANAQGTWIYEDQTFSATLESFTGQLFNNEVELQQPFSLRYKAEEKLTLSPLSLSAGDGSLYLAYAPLDAQEPLRFDATRFPLTVLEVFFPRLGLTGTLNGQILLSDLGPDAKGIVELSWEDVDLKDPLILDIQSVQGRIDGELRNGTFTLTTSMDSAAGSPLTADLKMPLEITGPPLGWKVDPDGPLHGRASFSGELGPIIQFFLPDTASVSGSLTAGVDIGGTAGSPTVKGDLTVSNATFEDYYSGGTLRDINAHLVAEGPELTLDRFTASDGLGGQMSATGSIEIAPHKDYPFQIDAQLQKMRIVNLDIAKSAVTGTLTFGGTLLEPRLTGDVVTDYLNIDLDSTLPARIPRLKVTYINVPPSQKKKRQRGHVVEIPLDIKLSSPNTTRLDGNGINSTWGGEVDVRGTAENLELHGDLNLDKGKLDIAGHDFKLTSGTITFNGDPTDHTNIQIVGTNVMDEIEINAEIKGTLPSVFLTFYSSPPLSTQEILAYLLFGRPATDATSNQLAQLNEASIDLSKTSYSSSKWQTWQKDIGLDELTITAPDDAQEEYGILAGKKLSKNFEVHVYRSINQEFNRTKIYVDFFQQFRLSGESGNEDSERFSLVWRKNY